MDWRRPRYPLYQSLHHGLSRGTFQARENSAYHYGGNQVRIPTALLLLMIMVVMLKTGKETTVVTNRFHRYRLHDSESFVGCFYSVGAAGGRGGAGQSWRLEGRGDGEC